MNFSSYKISKCSFLFVLFSQVFFSQQTILENSNLPIIVINTDTNPATGLPYPISDELKVSATMKLIFRLDGSRNYLTDINNENHLNYNGRIAIETRGSSSQELDKKPYGFTTYLADNTTKNNVSLLDMPSENDWVLNALAFDPSMMRDYLSYTLANRMGNYAPRVRYVEVIVNDDYKGVYILTEKIKIDSDRVNLKKLKTTDVDASDITGGYIIKADKTTGGDSVAWTFPNENGWWTEFLYDSPKAEDINSQQSNYIYDIFNDLVTQVENNNNSIVNGFPSIIDIPSFVDFMIMAELVSNPDAYQFSTYFHKDKGGKLRAGPIWDFNLSYGNDLFLWGFDRSHYDVWQFDFENTGPKFWKQLFNNTTFKCYLAKRWFEITAQDNALNYNSIINLLDETMSLLNESKEREQLRWETVEDFEDNIAAMKTWINNRFTWIDANIGSSNNCNNLSVPNLVISKIHYHPLEANGYSSKKLEFIEITNNSNLNVNLTGYYIKELGISYQFPVNSEIEAHKSIFLCNDTDAFTDYYSTTPFGEFHRSLSNKSYPIVLSDAFGNIIDEVIYKDDNPWPSNADGFGSYLQLKNLNADNSLASNWTLGNQNTLSNSNNLSIEQQISVFPNPTKGIINFAINTTNIQSLEIVIFNSLGQTVGQFQMNSNNLKVNVNHLNKGIYYYNLIDKKSIIYTNKFIKN